jgi:hypothetical protein
MLYHISRSGQTFGPYTLEDIQRYVASGNILLTDLAKSDEMPEWVPVSTLVAAPAAPPPPPAGFAHAGFPPAYPADYAPTPALYDPPPNLNWVLLMVLSFFTCSLFAYVWSIVLSAWMNRVAPASKQLALGIGVVVLTLVTQIVNNHHNYTRHFDWNNGWHGEVYHNNPIVSILQIALFVLVIYARFNMRNWMERHYNTVEPIGLRLSGVMTFFFGGLYFQYHMNRINEMKRALAYRAGGL